MSDQTYLFVDADGSKRNVRLLHHFDTCPACGQMITVHPVLYQAEQGGVVFFRLCTGEVVGA